MKSEIELLLHNLQNECDYFRYEIERCELQGEDDRYFRNPLAIASRKLKITKQLHNPTISKIESIEMRIKYLKLRTAPKLKNPYKVEEEESDFAKEMNLHFEEHRKVADAKRLKMLEEQLEKLKAKPPTPLKAEDDKFTDLLEQLSNNIITSISFELEEKSHRLQIKKFDANLQLKIIPPGNFQWLKGNTLSQLGFNPDSGEKIITDFNEHKIQEALQIITILLFEFFHFVGDEILQVKVG